jgi:transcriptional regulator with XRE-family HTH domain
MALSLTKKIRQLRKSAGWSQQQLAQYSELSYNMITKIEQGQAKYPSIQTVIKLADAFGMSLDDIVERRPGLK